MSHKSYVMIFVLLLTTVFFTAGITVASSEDKVSKDNGGYVVTPGKIKPGETGKSISSSVIQGQTNLHYNTISGFYTLLSVDLNWGTSSNSLRLKIYSPDGYTFGPFYDNYDGSTDGRIIVNIQNPNGIAQGSWRYEVYGYSVTGIESYTI